MKHLSSMLRIALGSLALLFVVTLATAAAKDRKPSKETLEKYDADKDGALDDSEQAAAKAGATAKAKETREANLAKYDANKDGKLDESERAARKAEEAADKAARKAERDAKKEGKADKN